MSSNSLSCTICATSPARRCTRCKSTAYCSLECQHTDWSQHQILCKAFSTSTPPPKEHADINLRRGIFFPDYEAEPRLVWVECEPMPGAGELADISPYMTGFDEDDDEQVGRKMNKADQMVLLTGNTIRNRDRNAHPIEIWFKQRPHSDDMRVNEFINTVRGLPLSSDDATAWRGPLLVLAREGVKREDAYTDVSLVDFRDVIDWVSWYRDGAEESVVDPQAGIILSPSPEVVPILESQRRKRHAVRINCLGHRKTLSLPDISPVLIPASHPIFRLPRNPQTVSERLGFDLRARIMYPPDKIFKEDREQAIHPPSGDIFLRNMDEMGSGSKAADERVSGSLLVAAMDKENCDQPGDLSLKEVKRIVQFYKSTIQLSKKDLGENESAQSLLETCTKEKFDYWVERYEHELQAGGQES